MREFKYDIRMNALKKLDYLGHEWSPTFGVYHNHFYVECIKCGARMEYVPEHVSRVKNRAGLGVWYRSNEWDGPDKRKCTEVQMQEALG